MNHSLSCNDVIQGPGAGHDAQAVAEHLAACPECSTLTRLWESTRPVEPTAAAWDSVWTRISRQLDHAAVAEMQPEPAGVFALTSRWQRIAGGSLVAAQAAAILAAVVLGTSAPTPVVAKATPSVVDIETGELTCIGEKGQVRRIPELVQDEGPNTISANFAMFNDFESLAE